MYFERLEELYKKYNNYSILSRMLKINRSTVKRWFDKSRIPKRSLTKSLKFKINRRFKKLTDLSSKQHIPFDNLNQFLNDVKFKLRVMRILYSRFKCVFVFSFCLTGEERQKGTSNFYTRKFDAINILREELENMLEVYNVVVDCGSVSTSTECKLIDSYILFF